MLAPDAVLVGCTVNARWVALPAVTTTAAVWVIPVEPMIADTVFVSATVEVSVPVATPPPSVAADGCVSVLPVPLALSVTVAPAIGLPKPSLAVTVMVDVPLPAAIGEDGGADGERRRLDSSR